MEATHVYCLRVYINHKSHMSKQLYLPIHLDRQLVYVLLVAMWLECDDGSQRN